MPGRDRLTQIRRQRQCAAIATASALLSSTRRTNTAKPKTNTHQKNKICATWAGRLSAVACPAVRIASEIDQPVVKGSIEDCSCLVRANIVNSASLAPGARAAMCEAGIGLDASAVLQYSGSTHSKL